MLLVRKAYLLAIGLFLCFLATREILKKIVFYFRSVHSVGQVVGTTDRTRTLPTRNETYYYPIIEFISNNGGMASFSGKTGSSNKEAFKIGTKKLIRYIESSPSSTAVLWDFWNVAFPTICYTLLAVAAFIALLHQH